MTGWRRLALLAALVAACPAFAADTLGQMTGFLDGDRHVWHLIAFEQGERRISSASFRQTSYNAELILHGHSGPRFASRGGLSLEVRYKGTFERTATPIGLDILYLPEGLRGPIWTSNDAPTAPTIEIIDFDVWGDVGHVEAVFSAQLCLRRTLYAPTDTTACKALSGQVATDLAAEGS